MEVFKMSLLFKKKYKVRHKILEALKKRQDLIYELIPNEKQFHPIDISLTLKEIVKETGYSENDIKMQIEILTDKKEITIITEDSEKYFCIETLGRIKYCDESYLEERIKFLMERIKYFISIFKK